MNKKNEDYCKKNIPVRYDFSRCINSEKNDKLIFVMLNPASDGEDSDNTINNCIKITDRYGYGGIEIINLFPLIENDAKKAVGLYKNNCKKCEEKEKCKEKTKSVWKEVAERNKDIASEKKIVVLAWGATGEKLISENKEIEELESELAKIFENFSLDELKTTFPLHPARFSASNLKLKKEEGK